MTDRELEQMIRDALRYAAARTKMSDEQKNRVKRKVLMTYLKDKLPEDESQKADNKDCKSEQKTTSEEKV